MNEWPETIYGLTILAEDDINTEYVCSDKPDDPSVQAYVKKELYDELKAKLGESE